ncbi:hypothetical protein O181_034578 [Austropuccinia psidii MF-1]|uniref:Uncharacterized protein n=1 Tax=Austropuccinia psidii MF-1 TaxID=1389203 RepID=A0A9Q3D5R9_9BASI|nr:hypothetical protein [Austropuccinia psidii MF-1]
MSPVHLRKLGTQGKIKRTDKECSEPEYQGQDNIADGRTLREIITILPFAFQFNKDLKPEDWKDMDQALQLHQLLKYLFQCSMDSKSFNPASRWAELGAGFQKICLKEIPFKDLILITK